MTTTPEISMRVPIFFGRCGWYLLSGEVARNPQYVQLMLEFWGKGSFVRQPLAMSLSGKFLELIYLPKGITNVELLVTSGEQTQVAELTFKPVAWVTALFKLYYRLGVFAFTQARYKRQQLGLGWHDFVLKPWFSYQRIGMLKAFSTPAPYPVWLANTYARTTQETQWAIDQCSNLLSKHGLNVLMFGQVGQGLPAWEKSLNSLLASDGVANQWLNVLLHNPPTDICPTEEGKVLLDWADWQALMRPDAPLLLLPAGVTLAPFALAWLLNSFHRGSPKLVYSDHDNLDADDIPCNPQFKPDWSMELVRASFYPGDLLLLPTQWFADSLTSLYPQWRLSHQLLLSLSDRDDFAAQHIPAVLWHEPMGHRKPVSSELLQHYFTGKGMSVKLLPVADFGWQIQYEMRAPCPCISIIIPTRNQRELLEPCVDSLLNHTDYPSFEVLVVDNQSDEPATLDYLAQIAKQPNIRVLSFDAPFNYAAINNYAVSHAKGDWLLLLNNDTKAINSDWLSNMMAIALQGRVGAVGARLLYAHDRVQHAGDVVGIGGLANHLHPNLQRDHPGYMGRAMLAQDLSAVTAACLLTPKALYTRLGGLDAEHLPVAFNDVDYCLRLREEGWRVLYTPLAELYHYESVSRKRDVSKARILQAKREVQYMRKRWKKLIQEGDPFYNPNLNGAAGNFALSPFSRVRKPWN